MRREHGQAGIELLAVLLVTLGAAAVAAWWRLPVLRVALVCGAAYASHLLLDWLAVDFMDSRGLRTLLGLRNDAKRAGRDLVLVPGPPGVQRIFALTATRGLFDWQDDREAV